MKNQHLGKHYTFCGTLLCAMNSVMICQSIYANATPNMHMLKHIREVVVQPGFRHCPTMFPLFLQQT